MTDSAPWAHRLRVLLALLILIPTFGLFTSHAEADAASWKTVASGWAAGSSPLIWLSGESKANPGALRIQVTNHAKRSREVDVTWSRVCELKNGRLTFASGDYVKKLGKGKTHTKNISTPRNAVTCDLSVLADVSWTPNGAKGKLTLKLQSS